MDIQQQMQSDDRRGTLTLVGIILVVIGVAIALWAVSIVYTILNTPDQVPLISRILGDLGGEEKLLTLTEDDGDISVSASSSARGIVLLVFFLFLFGSLGGIVSGLIAGGAKILTADRDTKTKNR
jgi:hypothetical protein